MARSVMSGPSIQEPAPSVAAVVQPSSIISANPHPENPVKTQRPFMDGDFEFVSSLFLFYLSFFLSLPLCPVAINHRHKVLKKKPAWAGAGFYFYFYYVFFFVAFSKHKTGHEISGCVSTKPYNETMVAHPCFPLTSTAPFPLLSFPLCAPFVWHPIPLRTPLVCAFHQTLLIFSSPASETSWTSCLWARAEMIATYLTSSATRYLSLRLSDIFLLCQDFFL